MPESLQTPPVIEQEKIASESTPVKKSFRNRWFLLIPVGLLILAGVIFARHKNRSSTDSTVDTSNPPKFVTADFIDLSKVYSISKFRSADGHDFSGGGETCRSMKHYFIPQFDPSQQIAKKANNGLPPKPDGLTDTDIFSPVDGKVSRIDQERVDVGEQIFIVPDSAPQYVVRLFHVYKNPDIQVGLSLKAGQKVGIIAHSQQTDIAIQAGDTFISYFSVMSDSVFASYQARGAQSRNDFILSRQYRDAHPVPCNQDQNSDQAFNYPAGYDHAFDDFNLSGYIAPSNNQSQPNIQPQNQGSGQKQNYGNGPVQ